MATFTCGVCKKQMSCYTDGQPPNQTVRVVLPWSSNIVVVLYKGEHCYPCPDCEKPVNLGKDEKWDVSSWDNIQSRLHKRLRQHYTRHHHFQLKQVLDHEGVINFYDEARRIRCQLLHGPPPPTATIAPIPDSSTSAAAANGASEMTNEKTLTNSAKKNFIFPPGAEERITEQGLDIQTAHARMRNLSGLKDNKVIPEAFITWLKESSELASSTIGSYLVVTRNFLGWLLENKTTQISLSLSWNIEWVKEFLDAVRAATPAPTTVYNYTCAISTIQKFTIEQGEATPTDRDKAQWAQIMKLWSRKKKSHQKVIGQEKLESTPKLSEFQKKIIDNESARKKYQELVELCRLKQSINPSDFKWATGYAILQLQSSNFKRNGNLSKIKSSYAINRLKESLVKLKNSSGKGNEKRKVTCTFEVSDATKTGGKEIFAIVNPIKMRVLYDYAKYIRSNCPGKVKDEDLFINSVGTSLKNKVSEVIHTVARSLGVSGVVIRDIRSRVETDAATHSNQVDRSELAKHLAHTEKTRDKFYMFPTDKRSKRAAEDVETLLHMPSSSDEEKFSNDEFNSEATDKRQNLRKRRQFDHHENDLTSDEDANNGRCSRANDDSDLDPTYSPSKLKKPGDSESPWSTDEESYNNNGKYNQFRMKDKRIVNSSTSSRGIVSSTVTECEQTSKGSHYISSRSTSPSSSIIFIEKVTAPFGRKPASSKSTDMLNQVKVETAAPSSPSISMASVKAEIQEEFIQKMSHCISPQSSSPSSSIVFIEKITSNSPFKTALSQLPSVSNQIKDEMAVSSSPTISTASIKAETDSYEPSPPRSPIEIDQVKAEEKVESSSPSSSMALLDERITGDDEDKITAEELTSEWYSGEKEKEPLKKESPKAFDGKGESSSKLTEYHPQSIPNILTLRIQLPEECAPSSSSENFSKKRILESPEPSPDQRRVLRGRIIQLPKSKTQSKTQPVTHDASQTVPTTNTQMVQQVYLGRGRGQPKTPAKSKGVGKGKGRGKNLR